MQDYVYNYNVNAKEIDTQTIEVTLKSEPPISVVVPNTTSTPFGYMDAAISAMQEILGYRLLAGLPAPKATPFDMVTSYEFDVSKSYAFRNRPKKEKYIKKTLTIPESLDTVARAHGINFSSAMVMGIKK
jgi:hypothetical protein